MATELNILMKQFNGVDYDTLYPKTKAENVENVYNKQEVLSDATKVLFQLPLEAVPDNAFNQLYQYLFGTDIQEYRWFRTKTEWVGNVSNYASKSDGERNMKYARIVGSNSYTIDSQGKFSLGPTQSATLEYPYTLSTGAFASKYIVWSMSQRSDSLPYPSTSGLTDLTLGNNNLNITLSYEGDSIYELYFSSVAKVISQKKTTNEIVTSTNPNAYPDSGTQDGWTYTKLSPILNKVGLITVGNYQGTGKSGASNKNSITTQYPPKVLIVTQENGTGLNSGAGILWVGQNKMNGNTFAVSGNTVSWYAGQVGAQMNTSGVIYHYLTIC